MNVHVPAHVVKGANDLAEGLAFFSLAKTQRVLAGQYRIWAREAEAEQNLANYRKYAAEARKAFRAARWHIEKAKERLHG